MSSAVIPNHAAKLVQPDRRIAFAAEQPDDIADRSVLDRREIQDQMLERHGNDRRPSAAYERLRTAARHGSNQALGDADRRDAGASAVPYSVTAADRDVAALRVVRDLYQPAPDLGEDRPVCRHVRDRGIGEWREAVEQVADANSLGPIGQSGRDAGYLRVPG